MSMKEIEDYLKGLEQEPEPKICHNCLKKNTMRLFTDREYPNSYIEICRECKAIGRHGWEAGVDFGGFRDKALKIIDEAK